MTGCEFCRAPVDYRAVDYAGRIDLCADHCGDLVLAGRVRGVTPVEATIVAEATR